MFLYGYDISYLVWMLPMLVLSLIVQANVKTTFSKYSRVPSERGLTGSAAARLILDRNNLSYIKIERIPGKLTDHYDPTKNVIRLSESVYDSDTAAAVGVAAHECGHAVQYAEEYAPIKIRAAIIPVTRFGANISWLLVFLGIIFSFTPLAYIGIILFASVVVFQLVTVPVEYNASNRALATLEESQIMSAGGIKAAKKVLDAAALTYVAALATSIIQLLYLISRVNRSRR